MIVQIVIAVVVIAAVSFGAYKIDNPSEKNQIKQEESKDVEE